MLGVHELVQKYFPSVKDYELVYDGEYDKCPTVNDVFKSSMKKCFFKFRKEISENYTTRFSQVIPNGLTEKKSFLQILQGDSLYVVIGVGKSGNGSNSFLLDFQNCFCDKISERTMKTTEIKETKTKEDTEYIKLLRKDLQSAAKYDNTLTAEKIEYLISNVQW